MHADTSEVCHRDDWVWRVRARRDEEWAPPVSSDDGGCRRVPDRHPLDLPPRSLGFCWNACWRGPWGSGAAAPQGALRAIDSSARPRLWAGLRPAPPSAAVSVCPGYHSWWSRTTTPCCPESRSRVSTRELLGSHLTQKTRTSTIGLNRPHRRERRAPRS